MWDFMENMENHAIIPHCKRAMNMQYGEFTLWLIKKVFPRFSFLRTGYFINLKNIFFPGVSRCYRITRDHHVWKFGRTRVITWKQSNARARDPIVFLQRYIGKISHFLNINY